MLKDLYDSTLSRVALTNIASHLSVMYRRGGYGTYALARKNKVDKTEKIFLYAGVYYISNQCAISGLKNRIALERTSDKISGIRKETLK
nr:MAG TPA: hypothetical protein [Microviridae sp.]